MEITDNPGTHETGEEHQKTVLLDHYKYITDLIIMALLTI